MQAGCRGTPGQAAFVNFQKSLDANGELVPGKNRGVDRENREKRSREVIRNLRTRLLKVATS